MHHRRLAFLFSILATGCGGSGADSYPRESAPDLSLAADTGPPTLPLVDAAADAADSAIDADETALEAMPDAAAPDTADALVDAAPPPKPAWDACEVVPTGDQVPTQLAKTFLTDDGASSLIVHGDRLLFVTGSNEIDMVKTSPGSAFPLLMETGIFSVATNGTDVVYSKSLNLGSTDWVGSFPEHFGFSPDSFAIDKYYAYYTLHGSAADGSDDSLYRVPIGGSGWGTEIATGPMGSGIAIDDSGLYLGSAYTPPLETPVLTIVRGDSAGSSFADLASREGFYDSWLALTPTHVVVFAWGTTNEIFTVRKSDGKVQTLATVAKSSFDHEIHVDATYAYWLESHQIRRVRLDGSKPAETIFRGACKPVSMTVDSKRVYFLTSPEKYGKDKGTTTAWSMEKPAG